MNDLAISDQERVVGRYEIVKPLKVGGTAAIYLAVMRGENNFTREVVVKRPLPHLVADNRARLMFVDEAHIAARLSHPNICQVLDLVAREHELYLVMEYLKGVDLREILKRCLQLGRLIPAEVAVWMAIEICAGLDYAHESTAVDGSPLNLVHRDLSPKNIRITHSGAVKIIDFGIARAMNRATETAVGTIKGTLGYMSPEQILGDEIDRRSDIFAFGICLFQMLTCRNPFDGPTLKERVRRLTQAPVPPLREFNATLDDEIEGIVAKCLERDLEDRYQRVRDVQDELDRYLSKLQVMSPRQQLINFLEAIFPSLQEGDEELMNVLTDISSVTGRIDVTKRLVFPDDADDETARSYKAQETASTIEADPGERPTIRSESEIADTKPPPDFPPRTPETVAMDTRVQVKERPIPWGIFSLISVAVVILVATIVALKWKEPIVTKVPETPPPETHYSKNTPKVPEGVQPDAGAPDAGRIDAGKRKKPPKRVVSSKVRPNRQKSRLFFKTARRMDRRGKTDDAVLLYHLSYRSSGGNPNATIYLNLGLIHDRRGNVAKARACLRGYLERRPGAPEASRIKTRLASYPPTKSVSCVSKREISRARKQYDRRGSTIDGWVEDTLKQMLK